jgi:pyruvate kinase
MRRTKIIATLGPASGDPEVVADLLEAGTDVVRLSLAHGSAAEHRDRIRLVRELAVRQGRTVGV